MRNIMAEWAKSSAWFDSQYGNRAGWGAGGYIRPLSSQFSANAVATSAMGAWGKAQTRRPRKAAAKAASAPVAA